MEDKEPMMLVPLSQMKNNIDLLDYFAGRALMGLIENYGYNDGGDYEAAAKSAYAQASAMIAERARND